MKNLQDYIGKELTPAITSELESRGVRVWTPGSVGTADFQPFRQNAKIKDNIIVSFYEG
jgi:hypothetical protein